MEGNGRPRLSPTNQPQAAGHRQNSMSAKKGRLQHKSHLCITLYRLDDLGADGYGGAGSFLILTPHWGATFLAGCHHCSVAFPYMVAGNLGALRGGH